MDATEKLAYGKLFNENAALQGRIDELEADKPEYCCPECAANSGRAWPHDYRREGYMRREQSVRVMPIIGPLLDAWDGTPNDFKSDVLDQYPTLHNALQDISKAVEQD